MVARVIWVVARVFVSDFLVAQVKRDVYFFSFVFVCLFLVLF